MEPRGGMSYRRVKGALLVGIEWELGGTGHETEASKRNNSAVAAPLPPVAVDLLSAPPTVGEAFHTLRAKRRGMQAQGTKREVMGGVKAARLARDKDFLKLLPAKEAIDPNDPA
ncbi:unnamed protein product, partial [Chrysoparadoxa australica]